MARFRKRFKEEVGTPQESEGIGNGGGGEAASEVLTKVLGEGIETLEAEDVLPVLKLPTHRAHICPQDSILDDVVLNAHEFLGKDERRSRRYECYDGVHRPCLRSLRNASFVRSYTQRCPFRNSDIFHGDIFQPWAWES